MKESEIRPQAVLQTYLKMSAEDADTYFKHAALQRLDCVACQSPHYQPAFKKHGFEYQVCQACGTLFQSPRPSTEAFGYFYEDSPSAKFWATDFFPSVAPARKEKIVRPRVEKIAHLCDQLGLTVDTLVDAGAGAGLFLSLWQEMRGVNRSIAIEPSIDLASACERQGFEVVNCLIEDLSKQAQILSIQGSADLVVCFEVFEHVPEPRVFLAALYQLLKPGGYLLITTLGVDGFDIQMLWDQSDAVSPPHHINFCSRKGFQTLFEQMGFADIVVTTPGELDLDIVANRLDRLEHNRFVDQLLASETTREAFQAFLVSQQLSSHTWVMARRAE